MFKLKNEIKGTHNKITLEQKSYKLTNKQTSKQNAYSKEIQFDRHGQFDPAWLFGLISDPNYTGALLTEVSG